MARSVVNPAGDLGYFLQIAEQLLIKSSLREIADTINLSPQALSDLLARLEAQLGAKLIERPPAARSLQMLPAGNELLRRLKMCLSPIGGENAPVQIKVAHSLTQVRSLISTLKRLRRSESDETALELRAQPDTDSDSAGAGRESSDSVLELRAEVDLDDIRETENLLTGELDLLLCWAIPQRIKKWEAAPGIAIETLGPRFPLALISHNPRIIEDCTGISRDSEDPPWKACNELDFKKIVRYKCALLDHDKQPFDEFFVHHGLYVTASRRILAKSFQSITEMVRARIADVGIVPLINTDLDALQTNEDVFYKAVPKQYGAIQGHSQVDTNVQVCAVHRKSLRNDLDLPSPVREMNRRTTVCRRIIDILRHAMGTTADSLAWGAVLRPLPQSSPEFYERLTYGYYLYRPDSRRRKGDVPGITSWHRETIAGLRFDLDDKGCVKLSGKATIRNQRDQDYQIEEARVVDGAFFLVAKEMPSAALSGRQSGFISVFSSKVEMIQIDESDDQSNRAIIVGRWSGGGGREKTVSTWSTIFSSERLSDDELNSIARRASMTITHCAPITGRYQGIPEANYLGDNL